MHISAKFSSLTGPWCLGFALVFGGACEDSDEPGAGSQLDLLEVLPISKRAEVGETFQFGAQRVIGDTTENVTKEVTLRSDDESIVRVKRDDGANVVEAVGPGTAHIIAEYDGKSATASVRVLAAVSEVSLDVSDFSLPPGTSKPLGVVLIAGDAKRTFDSGSWGSLDPSIASVDEEGVVTAHQLGETTITLSRNGLTTTKRVRVEDWKLDSVKLSAAAGSQLLAAGGTPLKVEGSFSAGARKQSQDVTALFDFSVAEGSEVLSVAGSNVTAGEKPGNEKVVAKGKAGSIAADETAELELSVVKANQLKAVRIEIPSEIALGMEDVDFKVLGDYETGTEIETTATELSADPGTAVTIRSVLKKVVPLEAADVKLKVLVTVAEDVPEGAEPKTRDVEATQSLEVVDAPLSMLSVSINTAIGRDQLKPGTTLQLEASAHYGTLAQTVTQPAIWTSTNPDVAVVSNVRGGFVTVRSSGTATLKASYRDKTAEFKLVVD